LLTASQLWPVHPGQPKLPYPKGLGPGLILQERAIRELATARESYKSPIPAPDYDQFQFPDVNPAPPLVGADETSQKAFATADALHREAVYLDAFATNYNRYLGAKRNQEAQAMLRLAAIMFKLAERASEAGQDAAQKQSGFEGQVEQKLNEIRAGLETKGVAWPTALNQAGGVVKSRGLPREIRRELTDAKVSSEEITGLQKQLATTTPELIDADITALKNPAPTDPPYISDLQNAQELAVNSWNEAKAAAPASQLGGASAPAATPAGGAAVKTTATSGHSVLFCSLFGSLGALVVVAFAMGFRSVRRGTKV